MLIKRGPGTIEKNVNDGQGQYSRELFAALRAAVSTRGRHGAATHPTAAKGKKKSKRGRALLSSAQGSTHEKLGKSAGARERNWGPAEPLRGIVEPIVDAVQPILMGNVMYGLLVGLLVATWLGLGTRPNAHPSPEPGVGYYSPSRQAAYDEMWRKQDSELWEWLEERVGLDRLNADEANGRKRAMEQGTVEAKLRHERLDEREIREAIRVTEEKLRVLKEVVERARPS